ncbi:hypothetical protein MTP04_36190 [Lysinibacillus sp. PLM2]|nr:hypothetical protein MTP04_36190 [Lysinibacillus sp. PLM2]
MINATLPNKIWIWDIIYISLDDLFYFKGSDSMAFQNNVPLTTKTHAKPMNNMAILCMG